MDDSAYNSATTALQCSIGNHLLEHPVTNHCGHTFCKVCLLQYKILNDACNKCQKRLPSYQFIQKQTPNILLNNLINIFNEVPSFKNIELARANQISNNIPVYLSDFAVLPSQKLRIPIYTEQSRLLFQKALIICKEYQCLCLGIVNKDKTNKKGRFGTMVKVTAIEQRANDMLVNVVGMDRFKVVNVNQEAEDFIAADLDMQFENYQDLENIMTSSQHWTERKISSPIKLSNRIYDFINDLSHSTPSNSFCSTVEGLLGPVWLDSVQGLHGPLPAAENPVAMCWWAAVVLPVSNSDRYHLLETISLEERLTIILSWINDLKSQWGNCRRTAINSATKVGL
ncbi:ATP-dependent protease La domain-containing protein [Thamnidium elegans]|nr:ATP-dependent protease La domain-containing protein [Thamnidium elegans]